jgi:hypothetical protein
MEPTFTRQTLLKKYTDRVVELAKKRGQEMVPRLDCQIKELQRKSHRATNDPAIDTGERATEVTLLTKKISQLAGERHKTMRMASTARNHLEGEVISKYWSGINSDRKPRDAVNALKNPKHEPGSRTPKMVTTSKEMAEITRDYHNGIQEEEVSWSKSNAKRTKTIDPALKDVHITLPQ